MASDFHAWMMAAGEMEALLLNTSSQYLPTRQRRKHQRKTKAGTQAQRSTHKAEKRVAHT